MTSKAETHGSHSENERISEAFARSCQDILLDLQGCRSITDAGIKRCGAKDRSRDSMMEEA